MIKAFTYGIREGLKHWRAALIVYSILFSLALTIGIQVYQVLEASIGSSLELDKLINQYDHTVISDFLKIHGGSISPLLGQLRWYIIVYLFFSVFINAGLIYTIDKSPKSDWVNFWSGGAKYFWPFLRIGAFFVIVTAMLIALIAIPASSYVGSIFNTTVTEMPMYYVAAGATVLILLVLTFLISWRINTKLIYLRTECSTWQSIKRGFTQNRKRWLSGPRLFLLFFLFMAVIVFVHLYIEGIFGMTSLTLIIIFFITQQLVVLFRMLWRIMVFESFDHNLRFQKVEE